MIHRGVPSSPVPVNSRRILQANTTPIKGAQRVQTMSSPARVPSSRLFTPEKPSEVVRFQEQLIQLPEQSWTIQMEFLKRMKRQYENKKNGAGESLLTGKECGIVMESLSKCLHSPASRVVTVCLEVMELYVTVELNREIIEKNESVLLTCFKRVLTETFMYSENANSILMCSILNDLLHYQCLSFNLSFLRFICHHLHVSSSHLISMLLNMMVVCISLHSEYIRQRDIYKTLLECCLQCVEMQSPLIERSLKGLIDCLYKLSPDLFRSTLSQCPTSRRMQFTEFVEKERININLNSPAKLSSSPNVSPSIQSRIMSTKPGVTDESSYVSEVCSESSQLLSEEWSVTVTECFGLLTRRLIKF